MKFLNSENIGSKQRKSKVNIGLERHGLLHASHSAIGNRGTDNLLRILWSVQVMQGFTRLQALLNSLSFTSPS